MTDDADRAAELQQLENDAAVARHRAKTPGKGRNTCAECGEGIHPIRRREGAQLCMECQTTVERALRGLLPRAAR